MTIALMILTSIYLVVVGIQDVKERKIYSFPCTLLSALWMIKISMEMWMPSYIYLIYFAVSLALYCVFTKKRIWGAGDSDLFFLFTVVFMSCTNSVISFRFLFVEILLFIVVLASALILGFLEANIRRMKLSKTSSIAVAPGFAIVIIAIMWRGVIGC